MTPFFPHLTPPAGYHGFFPPRPDQIEEKLGESVLKNGLVLTSPISVSRLRVARVEGALTFSRGRNATQAENFTATDTARRRLLHEGALSELEDLMNQVFAL